MWIEISIPRPTGILKVWQGNPSHFQYLLRSMFFRISRTIKQNSIIQRWMFSRLKVLCLIGRCHLQHWHSMLDTRASWMFPEQEYYYIVFTVYTNCTIIPIYIYFSCHKNTVYQRVQRRIFEIGLGWHLRRGFYNSLHYWHRRVSLSPV